MAGLVSPMVRGLCFALLALCSCRGTEHRLFGEITPTVVEQPLRDAGPPPVEEAGAGGGVGPVIDPTLDAGPLPDPDLDPSIGFPWTETLPGRGTCREGLYIGRFSCEIVGEAARLQDIFIGGTGQIVFTLRGSEEEQVLTITGGMLTDDLFPGFLNGAMLSGELDCLNGQRLQAYPTGDSPLLKMFEPTVLTGWLNAELVISGGFQVYSNAGPNNARTRWECDFEASAAP